MGHFQGAEDREEPFCPAVVGGREVLGLSHPSLVVQGEDLVESMAMKDFRAGRDNGHLKLLPVKNFGGYLTQWRSLLPFSSNFLILLFSNLTE